jgi:thiol-disulfide isomerase/thioredoxin
MTRLFAAVSLSLACISGNAIAADLTIKNVRLGNVIHGPPVTAEQLNGAVVFVEEWGIHCGPCLAQVPHIVQLQDELADFGLVIVAQHRQKATDEEVQATARARGINYTVTTGHVSGSTATGIPHCFVFDANGKCVFEGNPADADKPLRIAFGEAIIAKTGRDSFPKLLVASVDALKAGKPPAAILAKVQPFTRSPDADVAAAAKALVEALTGPGRAALEAARSQRADDPLAAYDRAQRLAVTFKGTAVGIDAGKFFAELKADKAVMAELRARPMLEKVRVIDQQLGKALGEKETPDDAFRKAMAGPLKQLRDAVALMKRQAPDARATKDAVVLAEKYGVK